MMYGFNLSDSTYFQQVLREAIITSNHPAPPPSDQFAPTSVMALFTSGASQSFGEDSELIFIQKADIAGYPWRNQMAFPGGHWDPIDADREATALRELEEEMGISSHHVHVIGSIGHFMTLKNKEIEAFIGIWEKKEKIRFDPAEISRVFQIPLSHLMAVHHASGYIDRYPDIMELTYPYEDIVIWGVTAKIVHHLLEILRPFVTLFDAFE